MFLSWTSIIFIVLYAFSIFFVYLYDKCNTIQKFCKNLYVTKNQINERNISNLESYFCKKY